MIEQIVAAVVILLTFGSVFALGYLAGRNERE